MSSDLNKLVHGYRKFRENVFEQRRALFESLATGQQPQILFITCSDSRIDPIMLTQTVPGELFILRTAGNIVPPYSAGTGGEIATIEYAVLALGIRDIVICGHSHCGAVNGALHPDSLVGLPSVAIHMARCGLTGLVAQEARSQAGPEMAPAVAVQRNVLQQLENLRTHPTVARGIALGTLKLHGWYYIIEAGEVLQYEAELDQFVPLGSSMQGEEETGEN